MGCKAMAVGHPGHPCCFSSVTGLVTEILECREDRALQRFHKQLERQQTLVLGELGYVPSSKVGAELFFDVISRAYEPQILTVTTNFPLESWTGVLGSERLTGTLLDRLTHRVHIIEANGEIYRLHAHLWESSNSVFYCSK